MKRCVIALLVSLFALQSAAADPRQPKRPPWGDVCCGGPCCVKVPKPHR